MPSFSVLSKSEGFFVFRLRAGLSIQTALPCPGRAKERKISRMVKKVLLALAAASLVLTPTARAGSFADAVVSYESGAGFAPRYTHPEVALGEPTRVNPFGDAVEPFNPPYGTNQIVSIGAGGHLVARFHTPVLNHPNNPRGLDFTIFGGAGFIITNEFDFTTFNWIGEPATDGSLFAQNEGETLVSVSRDGVNFFPLNPALAPQVDHFPPTDGAGDFHIPVAPELTTQDFSGATLDDVRTLYQGSGGGASYDISWAVDAKGRRVFLPVIRYVRVDVLSGKAEVDAFAIVERQARRGKLQ